MKPFQPMNVTEHLQALYNAGHDWAQEALGAVELFVESSETLDMADDLRRVLGLGGHCDAYTIVRQVEKIVAAACDMWTEVDEGSGVSQATRDELWKLLPRDT